MAHNDQPLSPDLQIYRPQLTSVLSITHRLTGVALSVGSPLLVCWLIAAAAGPLAYSALHDFLASWPGLALLFAWTFSLFFHLCNGIRHLFWDAGYGFELQTVSSLPTMTPISRPNSLRANLHAAAARIIHLPKLSTMPLPPIVRKNLF